MYGSTNRIKITCEVLTFNDYAGMIQDTVHPVIL